MGFIREGITISEEDPLYIKFKTDYEDYMYNLMETLLKVFVLNQNKASFSETHIITINMAEEGRFKDFPLNGTIETSFVIYPGKDLSETAVIDGFVYMNRFMIPALKFTLRYNPEEDGENGDSKT